MILIKVKIVHSYINIYRTLDYYINLYPQKRMNGKTCEQVRKESLEQKEFTQYPIIPSARYVRYWKEIEA